MDEALSFLSIPFTGIDESQDKYSFVIEGENIMMVNKKDRKFSIDVSGNIRTKGDIVVNRLFTENKIYTEGKTYEVDLLELIFNLRDEVARLSKEVEELKYVPPAHGGPEFRKAKESYDNCAGALDELE
jgi:hypothetical protein